MTAAHAGRRTRRWRQVRAQCRERDRLADAPCWICRSRIDYHLADGPDCWEPDHVIPLTTDPTLAEDPANIRASHRACNRSRQAKAVGAVTLGSPSRNW